MVRINDFTFGTFNPNSFTSGLGFGAGAVLTRIDNTIEGGGGSPNVITGGGVKITPSDYVLNIKSNVKGADVLVNGVSTGKQTPAEIRISKADLINGGDKTITLSKSGYSANEKYIVSLDTKGSTIIKNSIFNGGFGGISTSEIIVKYYINNIQSTFSDIVGNYKNLPFKLNSKISDDLTDELTKYNLTISLSGISTGTPILIRKNAFKRSEFFPSMGLTTYSDFTNVNYKIESSDLSMYRIVRISYNDKSSNQTPIVADDGESLTLDLKLNSNYSINIEVENIVKEVETLKPIIKLLKNDSRTYNINSELGVPIAFEKNSAVKAITIIVGDDILEFDDLEEGEIAGVTIPHSVFEKIGKYNVKLFPFSLSDYENEVRPVKPKPIIKPKPIKPAFDSFEEIKPIKPTLNTNPYVKPSQLPNRGIFGRGRGFGRRGVLEGEVGKSTLVGFVNDLVDNRNIL